MKLWFILLIAAVFLFNLVLTLPGHHHGDDSRGCVRVRTRVVTMNQTATATSAAAAATTTTARPAAPATAT